MNDLLKKIISLSRKNTFPLFVRNTKMMEEVGEFSEALMHQQGYLPHKTMKEPLEGEAADVLICLIDTLASAYGHMTDDEIITMLSDQLEKKSDKWDEVIDVINTATVENCLNKV